MATGLDFLLESDAKAPPTGLDALLSDAPPSPLVPKRAAPAPKNDPGMWSVIGNGLMKGAAGFADAIPSAAVNLANLGIAGYGTIKGLAGSKDLPDLIPGDALSGWNKVGHATGLINDAKEPTTGPQRVADFASQVMGGGGINPRALTRALVDGKLVNPALQVATPLLGGTAGGLASEAVRDNIDPNSAWAPAANAVLPLLAQLAGSYPTARMSPAGTRAAQTTKNITPEQWQQAQNLAAKAATMGAPLSAPEALQGVAGPNPGLQSLQRVTEQSGPGVNRLAPAFAQRPTQNASVLNSVAEGIFPNDLNPGGVGGTLNLAANNALTSARKAGNAQAAPFYAASSNDPNVKIPASEWNKITSDPDIAWALGQVKNRPLMGLQNPQPGSVQWLDAAKKFLDSKGSALAQSGDSFPAGNASAATQAITGAVDPLVPAYAKARSIIADNMQNVVEPMRAGQVGKLAETNDIRQQARALLPEAPMGETPAVIDQTARTINAQDPTVLKRFLTQYLKGTFNEQNQDLQAGGNQWGGANFAAKVAGNQVQGDNLRQLVNSAGADPMGLNNALDVFRAQGTRPHQGSATTFNNGETGLLSGGFLAAAGKPLQIPGLLAEKMSYALSTKDLARAIEPGADTVSRFQDLARRNGSYSPGKQAVAAGLLKAGENANTPATQAYADYLKEFDAAPDAETKRAVGRKYEAFLASQSSLLPASAPGR